MILIETNNKENKLLEPSMNDVFVGMILDTDHNFNFFLSNNEEFKELFYSCFLI